jgi:hypothetical protein
MSVEMANQTMGLQDQNLLNLPINREIIFTNHKNIYKQRIEKRQLKLMKKLTFIKPFLKRDEEIILITTGCSPVSILEQLLTGWIVFYLKRSLLVFTNKRIFHIPTRIDYSYRNSIAQVLYPDCQSIGLKGRKLVVKYKNGEKETFIYIARKEKKKINVLLKTISLEGDQSKARKRTHLCPRCTNGLEEENYRCPNCHLAFKDKAEARKLSLMYPGGGYFYTRHPFLGVSDAMVESILIVLVLVSLVDILKGVEGAVVTLLFFGIVLAFEKVISVYHSNHFIKEYITKEESF